MQELQELQEHAVATGQVDPKHDGGLENDTAGAPCGLDLLVKAGAQAEAVRSGLHTVHVAGAEKNAVQRPVGDRGAEPENISLTASPSVHPAHALVLPPAPPPALPLPLPLITEAQAGTPSSTEEIRSDTEEIRSDTEEQVLRLFPTTAQYHDFASLLSRAKEFGAENVGVFK